MKRRECFTMTTAAGVANQVSGQSVVRRRQNTKLKMRADAIQRSKALLLVLAAFALCLAIVFMSAFAANLKRENNQLQSSNEYLQAEIDSLKNQIGDSTNISKIETEATGTLGMVHPDSQNCITISKSKTTKTDLAATIKEEAYD